MCFELNRYVFQYLFISPPQSINAYLDKGLNTNIGGLLYKTKQVESLSKKVNNKNNKN